MQKTLNYTQGEFAMRVGVGLRFLKELELGHSGDTRERSDV